jgi:hypothetical protein
MGLGHTKGEATQGQGKDLTLDPGRALARPGGPSLWRETPSGREVDRSRN